MRRYKRAPQQPSSYKQSRASLDAPTPPDLSRSRRDSDSDLSSPFKSRADLVTWISALPDAAGVVLGAGDDRVALVVEGR